jgi:putative tricarboxylic transport membrane protein
MLEFSLILLLGLAVGVLVGLLPGVPAYIGPLLLYPFLGSMSVDQILAFWLASHIGSQYFGSVAAILLKIPGEASSLIYINDIGKLTIADRLALVRQTAWGSTVGSILSLLVVLAFYYSGLTTELVQLTSNNIKLALLTILIVTLCWFTNHKRLSLLLFFIGFFFAEKTNQDLPQWVFSMQEYTTDITLFSLILGFLIIPEFITEVTKQHVSDRVSTTSAQIKEPLNIKAMSRGTWLGSLIGLIPGPSHILSGIISYNSYKKDDIKSKIISAESANNSATITSLMPFLYIGIPITLSEFLLNDLLQVKLFMIPHDFLSAWPAWHSINFIELCFIIIAVSTLIYHFLAQKFLGMYENFLELAYKKLKLIFIALIAYLIYVDVTFNPVYIIPYLTFLLTLSWIGYYLSRRNVNILPLIFGFILGDMISWSLYQFYQIYFY